jgi:hypothetical protein
MSAAKQFALEATGPQVRCDFRGCILDAWHDGDHQFARPKEIQWTYDRHCVVCGVPFTVLGADKSMIFHTCGTQACLEHWARHYSWEVPVICRCPQREHPHELSVHNLIRYEWWKRELRNSWPWSLMASTREEPSTERKMA